MRLLITCIGTIVFFVGCKVRTINDTKVPQNGIVKKEVTLNGERIMAEEFYHDGLRIKELGRFRDDTLAYERFYRSGGRSTDSARSYYRSGTIRMIIVSNDTARVSLKSYYENGTLEAEVDSASSKEYYDDGSKKFEALMKHHQIYLVTKWYRNSSKKERSEWWNDQRNGQWIEWDSTGRITRNEKYKNGVRIK